MADLSEINRLFSQLDYNWICPVCGKSYDPYTSICSCYSGVTPLSHTTTGDRIIDIDIFNNN